MRRRLSLWALLAVAASLCATRAAACRQLTAALDGLRDPTGAAPIPFDSANPLSCCADAAVTCDSQGAVTGVDLANRQLSGAFSCARHTNCSLLFLLIVLFGRRGGPPTFHPPPPDCMVSCMGPSLPWFWCRGVHGRQRTV